MLEELEVGQGEPQVCKEVDDSRKEVDGCREGNCYLGVDDYRVGSCYLDVADFQGGSRCLGDDCWEGSQIGRLYCECKGSSGRCICAIGCERGPHNT